LSHAPGDNGGNTNWLSSCEEDAECGDGHGMCVSEACLKPCSDDDACDGIADTECRSLEPVTVSSGSCRALAETSLCAPRCDGDADCSELGDAYGCDDGVCTPTCPLAPVPAIRPPTPVSPDHRSTSV
jgi:hypothetical protein